MRCPTPESIKKKTSGKEGSPSKERVTIPCGKCATCLENRRMEWTIRLKEELRESKRAVFVTLTYNDENKVDDLSRAIAQAFIKKLRRAIPQKIRYYLVGEYGPHFSRRAHYHIVVFDCDLDNSADIRNCWDNGFITIDQVHEETMYYVAKYHVNKTDYEKGRSPPFALMSKGIGKNYVKRMEAHHDGKIQNANYQDYQYKKRLPRYYTNKLYTKAEREQIADITTVDLYDPVKVAEYYRKNPGGCYSTYIYDRLQEKERQYKQKNDRSSKI